MQWKTIKEETVSANQWFKLNRADVELPDGRHLDHYLLRQPPVALVAIVNEQHQALLLWRHRFIPDSWGFELPSGKVEDGEDIASAAAREALEETGWKPRNLRHLVSLEVSPAFRTPATTCIGQMKPTTCGLRRTPTSRSASSG